MHTLSVYLPVCLLLSLSFCRSNFPRLSLFCLSVYNSLFVSQTSSICLFVLLSWIICCVYQPANGCFAHRLLVKINFFNFFQKYLNIWVNRTVQSSAFEWLLIKDYANSLTNIYFNQRVACVTPVRWSKYTTIIVSVLFVFVFLFVLFFR